jgi:hypothetical protein
MRPAIVVVAALLAIQCPLGHAQSGAVSPLALVGTWAASVHAPNGNVIAIKVNVTANMKFSWSATKDGKPLMDCSGTWELAARRFTWHYLTCSRPLPESEKNEVDDIISIDAGRLVLASHLSGEAQVYTRSK